MKRINYAAKLIFAACLAGTLCLTFSLSPVAHSISLRYAEGENYSTTAQLPSSSSGFTVAVAYAVKGGGSGFAPPTFTFVVNGANQTIVLSLDQVFLNPDVGSEWTAEGVLNGSTSTERWATNQATTGTVGATPTLYFVYYHQYSISFTHRVIGGGSPSPSVKTISFAQVSSASSPGAAWLDFGSNYTYPSSISGSGLGERWVLNSTGFGVVTQKTPVYRNYFHQFRISATYSVIGSGSPGGPRLSGISVGSPISLALAPLSPAFTSAPASVWLDSGSKYSFTDPLPGSTTDERWYAGSNDTGRVSIAEKFALVYYHQYRLMAHYSVVGGISPAYPLLSALAQGRHTSLYLFTTPGDYWMDSGSSYAISNLLVGSSSTERWIAGAGTSGRLGATSSIEVVYYHQYLVSVSYPLLSKGTSEEPSLNFVAFGRVENVKVSASLARYWVDNGTTVAFAPSIGTTPGERWEVGPSFPRILDGSLNLTLKVFHQFAAAISFTASGFNGSHPQIVGRSFGMQIHENLSRRAGIIWLDEGSRWSISSILGGTTAERWATTQPTSGEITSPFSLNVVYVHQYAVSIDKAIGGNSSLAGGWYDEGASISLKAIPEPTWVFAGWIGKGSGAYSGNNASAKLAVNGPIEEQPSFDTMLTIRAIGAGSVSYVYGAAAGSIAQGGSVELRLPPGTSITLFAKPSSLLYSFKGWGGMATGSRDRATLTVNGLTQVTASFTPDYVALTELAIVMVLLAFGALILWKNRTRIIFFIVPTTQNNSGNAYAKT